MKYLFYYDIKRNFPLMKIILTILTAWIAIFFFAHFFAQDMTEDRLLEKLSIGIVDNDKSTLSNMLLANFVNNDQFSSMMKLKMGEIDKLQKDFDAGELTAIVTIPKGFTNGLLHYQNLPLSVQVDSSKPLKAMILMEVFDSYSDYIEAVDSSTLAAYETLLENGFTKEKLHKINELFSMQMVTFTLSRNNIFSNNIIHTFPATNSFTYFIAAILCLCICFLSTGIIFSIYNDFRSFCIHRYSSIKHNFYIFTASKLLSFSIIITFIAFLIAVPLLVWLSIPFHYIFILLVELFIYSIFFTAFFLLIGLLLFSEGAAALFCNMFIFILGLLGGNFIPLSLMPKMIQNISMITPNYHIIQNLLYSMSTINKSNIMLIVLCIISAIICYLVACKIINTKLTKGGFLNV